MAIKNIRCSENDTVKLIKSDIYKEEMQKKLCEEEHSIFLAKHIGTDYTFKHKIVWKNAIGFLILHSFAIWGLLIAFTGGISLKTFLWIFFLVFFGGEGITAGAHRLFAHKTYKAKPLFKALLLIGQTISGQNAAFTWCRDHRLHHRYSDTDGDPHNSKRGFFFSHIGWLMYRKHPYVIELGKNLDMSDLEADWMVMFQKKYYFPLYTLLAVSIPVWIPVHYFGESLWNSLLCCYFTRYVLQLNGTWLVNSAAHLYGTKPYDKNLQAVESWFVSLLTFGEGWHNYHHAFPWDYKTAELNMHFNTSAYVIRFFEKIGLAYDLKTASLEMVKNRIIRTGDGTHYKLGNDEARSAVTAFGIVHPLNPSYTTKYKSLETTIGQEGFPLFHENDRVNIYSDTDFKKKNFGSS